MHRDERANIVESLTNSVRIVRVMVTFGVVCLTLLPPGRVICEGLGRKLQTSCPALDIPSQHGTALFLFVLLRAPERRQGIQCHGDS